LEFLFSQTFDGFENYHRQVFYLLAEKKANKKFRIIGVKYPERSESEAWSTEPSEGEVFFFSSSSNTVAFKQKITTWMKTECRGNFSYEVLKFPLRIGFSPRKPVFESFVVVIFCDD